MFLAGCAAPIPPVASDASVAVEESRPAVTEVTAKEEGSLIATVLGAKVKAFNVDRRKLKGPMTLFVGDRHGGSSSESQLFTDPGFAEDSKKPALIEFALIPVGDHDVSKASKVTVATRVSSGGVASTCTVDVENPSKASSSISSESGLNVMPNGVISLYESRQWHYKDMLGTPFSKGKGTTSSSQSIDMSRPPDSDFVIELRPKAGK